MSLDDEATELETGIKKTKSDRQAAKDQKSDAHRNFNLLKNNWSRSAELEEFARAITHDVKRKAFI